MVLYQPLVSGFVLDANSLRPPTLKNINVSSAFHVNKSTVKLNMLSMVPYKLLQTKYLLIQSLSFNLVLKNDLLRDKNK